MQVACKQKSLGEIRVSTDAKKNPVRVSRRVECALMPDIYADASPIEKLATNIVDDVLPTGVKFPEFDSSEGFNPYDTGVLYKK